MDPGTPSRSFQELMSKPEMNARREAGPLQKLLHNPPDTGKAPAVVSPQWGWLRKQEKGQGRGWGAVRVELGTYSIDRVRGVSVPSSGVHLRNMGQKGDLPLACQQGPSVFGPLGHHWFGRPNPPLGLGAVPLSVAFLFTYQAGARWTFPSHGAFILPVARLVVLETGSFSVSWILFVSWVFEREGNPGVVCPDGVLGADDHEDCALSESGEVGVPCCGPWGESSFRLDKERSKGQWEKRCPDALPGGGPCDAEEGHLACQQLPLRAAMRPKAPRTQGGLSHTFLKGHSQSFTNLGPLMQFLHPGTGPRLRPKKTEEKKALGSVGSFAARELVSARSCRQRWLPPKGPLESARHERNPLPCSERRRAKAQ
ncbi:hypothetical protein Cadr_000006164 [Camelus dromedarius]|uniref:Uncharacterized protein n=1 Tax=Camelus dromedarius TaxID=9838 RepID=A0A5N4E538_CAMDR|nr:hypothetical protein Cadr_000006164 [Camelus dromedarius]